MSDRMTDRTPVVYIIACGGPPAADLASFVSQVQAARWDVCVVGTPSGMKFLDVPGLTELTGHPVRSDYKRPEDPDTLPGPDAVIVAPATFNTINKWAAGISDTLALGLLNEAIGLGLPVIAVPFLNLALAKHPVFVRSVAILREWGVRVMFDLTAHPLPKPGTGSAARGMFPWGALGQELARLAERPNTTA